MKKLLYIALSMLAIVAILVALLETVPRFVEVPGLTLRELDPVRFEMGRARVEPHPYLAYVPKPGFESQPGAPHQVSHNSLGFRGPEISLAKPEGVLRVACLGGSSTYGHGPTSNATTWPARLEAHLSEAMPGQRIEVVNAGCQGWSTFELQANLAFRVLDLQPDLVIVYETINDMRCALYPDPKPDNTHWRAVWQPLPENPLAGSITWLAWRQYLTSYHPGELGAFVIVDFDPKRDPYHWRPGAEQGFRNIERNLHSIVSLAQSSGVQVLFGTQALRREDVHERNPGSAADQLRAFDRVTAKLRRVAAERGVPVADPQGVLAGRLAERRQELAGEPGALKKDGLFTSEVHVTDEGADLIALTFARAIVEGGLLRP